MAKRLTDSNKWSDNWYTELPMDIKLVWLYILDNCDHAGVYKVNMRLLKFQTECNRTENEILSYLKERIYIKADKWFIPKFITFQYKNFFTSNTPAIKSARELLISHNILDSNSKELPNPSITLTKGLDNGYERAKDMDKDIDMDMNKDINKNKDKVESKDIWSSESWGIKDESIGSLDW